MTPATEAIRIRPPDEDEQLAKRQLLPVLERDRARWMLDQPFLGSLSMRLELVPVVDSRLPTAATDGRRIFFNARFAATLDAETRRFVMAHEVWHCAALHFPRRGTREPRLWNLAIDHETNSVLRQQGFKLPQGAVHFPAWVGKNAESVYAALLSERLRVTERGPLADVHDPARRPDNGSASMAEELRDRAEVGDGTARQASGDGFLIVDPDYAPGCPAGSDAKSAGESEGHSDSSIWQAWPRQIVAAAQIHKRHHGTQPGWMHELLQIVGSPSVPWQELLRRFTQRCSIDHYRWTQPNRRFIGQGLFLPSRRTTRLQLAVGLDLSGSTLEQIPRFMAELKDILHAFEHFTARIIACDTRIVFDQVFDEHQALPSALNPSGGGGGTDLQPVFDAIDRDDHAALVFLTDGFADPPTRPDYPVLWALTEDGQAPVDWGEVIRLDPP